MFTLLDFEIIYNFIEFFSQTLHSFQILSCQSIELLDGIEDINQFQNSIKIK
jgi:spore coat polysaccharide biosynthesis protein SpsF (cytidylyltransferase family)